MLTGASGNTGSLVIDRLKARLPDVSLVALVRPGRASDDLISRGLTVIECDLACPTNLAEQLLPDDLLVNIANLRYSVPLSNEFQKAGAEWAVQVTTTAVFSTFHSYSDLYKKIEQEIRTHPLKQSILRPSMIYGNHRDHNMHKLLKAINRWPVFPVFGDGRFLMMPVHVEDLADGIVSAVERKAIGEFNLAGPEPLSYYEILTQCIQGLGKNTKLVRIPHGLVASPVRILQHIPKFPIKHEQVMRLLEDKSFDISGARATLDYSPRSFELGIRQEVEELRSHGLLG